MIERRKLIKKLNNNANGNLSIITINGITIANIRYVDIMQDEKDLDTIYIIVDHFNYTDISINFKAIKFVREFKDIVEITVG